MSSPIDPLVLLRLLQYVSPSLPIGAYAYSQGLEAAVEAGWVHSPGSLSDWLKQQLSNTVEKIDLPLLVRLYQAISRHDTQQEKYWSQYLLASRETRELVKDEVDRGRALARLLRDLGVEEQRASTVSPEVSFVGLFARAMVHHKVPLDLCLHAYAWSWLENQVLAGVKLIPLGQVAGQRILTDLATAIPDSCVRAMDYGDEDIGGSLPMVAIASSWHETQYTRLFRS